VNIIMLGVIAGVTFAFARGFTQAMIDDWHRWRMKGKEVVINDRELARDEVFLDELEVAVQRSFGRRQK
jgi:hypothetical protein